MNHYPLFVIVVVAVAILAILALVKAFKVFNSPDGERYRRMKMQGPFVPLSEEDIAADKRRILARRGDPGSEA